MSRKQVANKFIWGGFAGIVTIAYVLGGWAPAALIVCAGSMAVGVLVALV